MTEQSETQDSVVPGPSAGAQAGADGRPASEQTKRVDALVEEARGIRRLDYDRYKSLAEEAFEIACSPGGGEPRYEEGMAAALALLAHRTCVLGDSMAALSQGSQALGLIDPEMPSLVLGEIYDAMGWAHYTLGDYPEALSLLMKALRIAESIKDRSLQAYVLDSIANVYSGSQEPHTALEIQERALEIHRELGDRIGEIVVLNNLSYTLIDLGDPHTALQTAKMALESVEAVGRIYLYGAVLDTLANVYLHMGDLEAAHDRAQRALEFARAEGLSAEEADGLMLLGKIAFERGEMEDAERLTLGALTIAEKDSRKVEVFQCHELLSRIYEQRHEYAEALNHFRIFHDLEREKHNLEIEGRLASLRVEQQVDTAKKDAEIQRLRNLALQREVRERKIAQARLEAQASLDPLTGLYNRRHLPVIDEQLAAAAEEGYSVSLVLFDVDHFKRINDTHGHLAGDRVLVWTASQLREHVRETDTPCRYGGDEFLVLLVGMDLLSAGRMAERLRATIAQHPVMHDGESVRATVSVGISTYDPLVAATLETLLARAARALYRAKRMGRDRIVMGGD